jgi:hypothetical protein
MSGARSLLITAAALLVLQPAVAQTTFVSDSFTTGVNQLLEAHAPGVGGAWTRFTGASGIRIPAANDNIRNVAAGDWNVYGNAAVPPADEYVVGITITFTASNADNYVQVFGRGNIVTTSGYFAHVASTGIVLLGVVSGGTASSISDSHPWLSAFHTRSFYRSETPPRRSTSTACCGPRARTTQSRERAS